MRRSNGTLLCSACCVVVLALGCGDSDSGPTPRPSVKDAGGEGDTSTTDSPVEAANQDSPVVDSPTTDTPATDSPGTDVTSEETGAGSLPWVVGLGGTGEDEGIGVGTDAAGNSYVVGHFFGTATFGSKELTSAGGKDVFVAKLDPSGNVLWARSAGGAGEDDGLMVAVDPGGNCTIAGGFSGTATFDTKTLTSAGKLDVFVARYSSEGTVLWAASGGSVGDDAAMGVSTVAGGDVVVTGYLGEGGAKFGSETLQSKGKNDFFVARFDATGALTWTKSTGGIGWDSGIGVASDATGNTFVTGYYMDTAVFGTTTLDGKGTEDMFVAKYSPTGQVLWAASAGGEKQDEGLAIAVDSSGSAWVAGFFQTAIGFGATQIVALGDDDTFVAKYSSEGALQWAIPVSGAKNDEALGIAITPTGDAMLAGFYEGSMVLGETTLTAQGASDVFLAKVSPEGKVVWALSAGGPEVESGYSLAIDSQGVATTGLFKGTPSFGTLSATSKGGEDAFVWKMALP